MDDIQLGLHLKGRDARKFEEYLENPTCTPKGIELIRRAVIDAREGKFRQQ